MKGYEMYEKIQGLKQKGYSQRRASRELKVSRDTIDKYWDMSEADYAQCLLESKSRLKILDPYRDFIVDEIKKYSEITGGIIHDHLLEHFPELTVSARATRHYVAMLREELGLPSMCAVRQYAEVAETAPGFQAQVDMGEKAMRDFFGKSVKVYIFAMVMSHSRKKFVCFQDHKFNAGEFVTAHDLAFRYFGGRTQEIVYDQDRVMSVSENAGDLILTETFDAYSKYAGFGIRLCRGHDPESKGKIESVIKYVKGNFLTCREYPGISKLNSDGLAWLERTANEKKHDTTYLVPNHVFLEEIKRLTPVPTLSSPPLVKVHNIRKTNIVSYNRNRYEVPKGTYRPGRQARIEAEDPVIRFYDVETSELLAQHDIYPGFGKKVPLAVHSDKPNEPKYAALRQRVLAAFALCDDGETFVKRIEERYPRYIRDQLSILRKAQEKYDEFELSRALAYCNEREIYSANDFRDVLEHLKSEVTDTPVQKVDLPVKYSVVRAQERDLSVYNAIAEGGVSACSVN